MRYIAKPANTVVMNRDNEVAYRFFNGELTIGSPTANTNAADIMDFTERGKLTLMSYFKTDLSGKVETDSGCVNAEIMGLGTFGSGDNWGISRGIFYEAPPITPGETAVAAVPGIWYRVIKNSVVYKGVTYRPNETFISDGTITAATTTDGGTFALTFPEFVENEKADRDAQFRQKRMLTGRESVDYQDMNQQGFAPRNAIAPGTIGTGYGWTE